MHNTRTAVLSALLQTVLLHIQRPQPDSAVPTADYRADVLHFTERNNSLLGPQHHYFKLYLTRRLSLIDWPCIARLSLAWDLTSVCAAFEDCELKLSCHAMVQVIILLSLVFQKSK